jgi:Zn-dependent M28 family amino/carboxypeptidase
LAVPRHIFANSCNNGWVREELTATLEGYGLAVSLQGRYRNVVALPRHTHGQQRLTLVAAHYDSTPDCPGADDNASGLAVMLECARVCAQTEACLPVAFIAFNAEEDGLLGSQDFIMNGVPDLPHRIQSAHVLEMVGFRSAESLVQDLPFPWVPANLKVPNFIGLLANGRSNRTMRRVLKLSGAPGLRLVGAKTWGPLYKLLPDLTRSDHFPFWQAGLPAVLWTDTGNFRNPHYHQATDTPDTLDYSFMREVTELLSQAVLDQARA